MKIFRFFLTSIFTMIVLIFNNSSASELEGCSNTINLFEQSPQVQPYFKNAYGYAVFPTVGKGGLGIGGA